MWLNYYPIAIDQENIGSDLKAKLEKEGSELSEKIRQLKMEAEDGKMRMTDVAATDQPFRLI